MADNATKEEMKKLTERLEQGILDFMDGEKFKTYLRTVSKFHNYSLNNTILIANSFASTLCLQASVPGDFLR